MILFIEAGRLANQLFQYAALRTAARPGEALVLLGFDELKQQFENLDAVFPLRSRSTLLRAINGSGRPRLDRLMARQPLISFLHEAHEDNAVAREPRMLRSVAYCTTSYFQSEAAFNPAVVTRLRMRSQHVAAARATLDALATGERPRVFVHVRRGDYLHYPSTAHPAALPTAWFRSCLATMRRRLPDPVFIACTDDRASVAAEFADEPDVHISRGDAHHDFALMSSCDAGILSPSSFSWWSAFFAGHRGGRGPFLAPEYWIGHSTREWYPPGIAASFLEFAGVDR